MTFINDKSNTKIASLTISQYKYCYCTAKFKPIPTPTNPLLDIFALFVLCCV